jgi:hypothetical protein
MTPGDREVDITKLLDGTGKGCMPTQILRIVYTGDEATRRAPLRVRELIHRMWIQLKLTEARGEREDMESVCVRELCTHLEYAQVEVSKGLCGIKRVDLDLDREVPHSPSQERVRFLERVGPRVAGCIYEHYAYSMLNHVLKSQYTHYAACLGEAGSILLGAPPKNKA